MSLSSLKRRISTIKNTSKITKAMSLISAAQLSKLKHMLHDYLDYYKLIREITSSIAFKARNRFDNVESQITIDNQLVVEACQSHLGIERNYIAGNKKLLIVVTGEKGLCGSFNSSVVNNTLKIIDGDTDVMSIGRKGYEMLIKNRKTAVNIVENNYIELNPKQLSCEVIMKKITDKIIKLISSNIYSKVEIIYTEFRTMLKQEVVIKELFPLKLDYNNSDDISCDSNPMAMLDEIIIKYLNSLLYFAILNSVKSEAIKRMMTMDNANKNSKDMLNDLTLRYNRVRQTKVTMELIEVISGMV
jgi:F-type H+-transporting ATPase subunit gamma